MRVLGFAAVDPPDVARKKRAEARAERIVLRKGRAGDPEVDFSPVFGIEAISLATRLSTETHSLAGIDALPTPRAALPVRFVARGSS